MKRLLALSVAVLTLAACSQSVTARYRLTVDTTIPEDTAYVTQQTLNVMQRRLESMGETLIDGDVESSGSGESVVSITVEHQEAVDALTEQMMQPFSLEIMAQAENGQNADVTVEGHGGFVKTGITLDDLSWVDADEDPDNVGLGRVHLEFTDEGRAKMADLFKRMKGKNIGIFVRNQLVSKLQVETDVLKDDIVIQAIPSLELAQTFADDVNVGIHVIVTPLP
jgi:preprotein translocase subunit SecD